MRRTMAEIRKKAAELLDKASVVYTVCLDDQKDSGFVFSFSHGMAEKAGRYLGYSPGTHLTIVALDLNQNPSVRQWIKDQILHVSRMNGGPDVDKMLFTTAFRISE